MNQLLGRPTADAFARRIDDMVSNVKPHLRATTQGVPSLPIFNPPIALRSSTFLPD